MKIKLLLVAAAALATLTGCNTHSDDGCYDHGAFRSYNYCHSHHIHVVHHVVHHVKTTHRTAHH